MSNIGYGDYELNEGGQVVTHNIGMDPVRERLAYLEKPKGGRPRKPGEPKKKLVSTDDRIAQIESSLKGREFATIWDLCSDTGLSEGRVRSLLVGMQRHGMVARKDRSRKPSLYMLGDGTPKKARLEDRAVQLLSDGEPRRLALIAGQLGESKPATHLALKSAIAAGTVKSYRVSIVKYYVINGT